MATEVIERTPEQQAAIDRAKRVPRRLIGYTPPIPRPDAGGEVVPGERVVPYRTRVIRK